MKPQSGPSSKEPIMINRIHEVVADLPEDSQICAIVCPVGIQVQLFYDDFSLEKALCSIGPEAMDITHLLFESEHIPQYAITSFIQDNFVEGIFDVSGILYLSFESFQRINTFRAIHGQQTFRYVESALHYILNNSEFTEELRFTPNWSDAITALPCISTYQEFLEVIEGSSQNECLFETMEYILCTVKTIDNIHKLKHDTVFIQYGHEVSDFPKNTIIMFNNDLSKIKFLSCAQTNVIATIYIDKEPDRIKIEAVAAEPDRYGRIRPVISSDEVTKYETEFYTIPLLTMEDLAKQKYQVGDIVEVQFINKIPKLGRIVQKGDQKIPSPIVNNICSCGAELIYRMGHLYCPKPTCFNAVFDKILYAKSRRVLDLPFDWHSIHDLVVMKGCVYDIPSIFNLDRSTLMTMFDTDMVDFVLKVLRTRMAQLDGDHFSSIIQNQTQGKFLDALSIAGLHSQNIKRLRQSLAEGDWQWTDLPLVLTDPKILRSFNIQRLEALEIAKSAQARIHELDTLIRDM